MLIHLHLFSLNITINRLNVHSAPSGEPSDIPSGVPSADPTGSFMPSSDPTVSLMPSGSPSTTCFGENVNTYQELVDAIDDATSSNDPEEIIVCPGTITFTDIIDFSDRYFELRCLEAAPADACVFDLNQFSFVTSDNSDFSADFENILIKNGNSVSSAEMERFEFLLYGWVNKYHHIA